MAVHIEKDSDEFASKPEVTDDKQIVSEDKPKVTEHKPIKSEDKSDVTEDKPAESSKPEPVEKPEPEEKPVPQFGRSKTRKGIVKKSESDGEEKSNKPPVPTSSSVTVLENEKELSFGRTKTKRTGR